jgi:hypothetical protein
MSKKDCPPHQRFRKSHERKLRNGKLIRVSSKCVHVKSAASSPQWSPSPYLFDRSDYKRLSMSSPVRRAPRKSAMRKSPIVKSPRRFEKSKCKASETWRRPHERKLRDGSVKKFPGMCVKSRPSAKRSRSPRVRKNSPSDCGPQEYWRKPHQRKLRNGSVLEVKGDCVKRQMSMKRFLKSPRARKNSPSDCGPQEYWRKPHQRKLRNGSVLEVKGDCVKKPFR